MLITIQTSYTSFDEDPEARWPGMRLRMHW